MPNINVNDLRNELGSMRKELKEELKLDIGKQASSEWSAHANWKSSSKELLAGDFDIKSKLILASKYDAEKALTKLSEDASGDKLVEVAKSLSELTKK